MAGENWNSVCVCVCVCVCLYVHVYGSAEMFWSRGYSDQNKKRGSCTDPLLSRVAIFGSVVRLLSVSCGRSCF